MAFVSEIIRRPVTDVDGRPVGIIKDLVARNLSEFPHPVVEAVVIQHGHETRIVPLLEVAALLSPTIPLKKRVEELTTYPVAEQDILLARDVLDKQIIDTDGARVVRVNDVELVRVNGTIYVGNVDISGAGLLRRLGLAPLAAWLRLRPSALSWHNVEVLRRDQSMRLRVPVDKIRDLHPADVAEILSDLNKVESGQLLESFDVEHLADALEEIEPEFQASLVAGMSDEKVADLLEEMEPDEAADLLADLPVERKEDLLALMEQTDAAGIRKLLAYPEDSAGGIMTTEYAAVHANLTASQAIAALRQMSEEVETMFYVYVLDEANCLAGVFSLSNLIFAPPDQPVSAFMETRVQTVSLYADQESVAQTVAKYDLVAVPVVDDQHHLHGIVTADDALDKMIPTAWKKRLPRFYH